MHRAARVYQAVVVCLLLVQDLSASNDPVQLSEAFGGPHGVEFSDQAAVVPGQTIGSLMIRANKRVDGVSLDVTGPSATKFTHGGSGGTEHVLQLGPQEYVTSMEVHWGQKSGRTRVFYLSFGTSAGNAVSGGSKTDAMETVTAPEGFQLGGFFGRGGDELDKLGAIWSRISADAPATEAPVTEARATRATDPSRDSASSTGSLESSAAESTDDAGTGSTDSAKSTDGASAGSADPDEYTDDYVTGSADLADSIDDASAGSLGGSGDSGMKALGGELESCVGGSDSCTASDEDSAAASTAGSSSTVAEAPASEPLVPPGTEAPAGPTIDVKDSVVLSESFGGPHGRDFSDKNLANSGQTVKSIAIYANKRLDGISLSISAPKALTFTHGGTGGTRQELVLGDGEYINSMEVHRGKKDGNVRIFYVNFLTSAGKSLSGGTMTGDKFTVTAPEGFQLAGFFGKDGKEIDTLGAVWAYIEFVKPAPIVAPVGKPSEDSPGEVVPVDIAGSLSEVKAKVNNQAVQLSDSFGGPHGEQFSDQRAVTSGMTITSVTIRAAKRVDGLTVQVSLPKEMTFTHGGPGGKEHTMVLEPGEYITKMEAHWGQRKGHTRIFFLSLGTSKGRSLSGGSQTSEKGSATAPKGYQLAGFFGRSGDEMDLIGAVWSSIEYVNETVSAPADENIMLSQFIGGPHGNAFSDIKKIKYGHVISTVSIRANLRLDAVTVHVTAPADVIMNHGGSGGTEQSLALGPTESITSVEIHAGKKSGRTRVFYICFTTSEGKTLAGGTKTDYKITVTPPEGFRFAGLYGRSADEVDQLGVIWTRIDAKNLLLTDSSNVGNNSYGGTIRNWVGPTIGKHGDTACYRKSVEFDSKNKCPLGYGKQDFDCVVQCPLAYPVTCGLECIPQNDDCVMAVLTKIGAAVTVALNLVTGNLLGSLSFVYKTAKWAALCVGQIISLIRGLLFYMRYRQTTAPVGKVEEMLAVAYQADLVVHDFPITVMICLGFKVSENAKYLSYALATVQGIVKVVITNPDLVISSASDVINLLSGAGLGNKSSTTVDEVEDIIAKNTSCGFHLKRLTDRITRTVLLYRNESTSVADLRVKVYKTSIVLNDIPVVTNNCMEELLATKTELVAFENRDLIRKTFGVIVDQLIETGKTDNGKDVAEDEYALEVANMGLVGLSLIDPSGIAYLASQMVQPICGPTAYVGEIDDGTLYDALGLSVMDEAFVGTYGSYTHSGDGIVHFIFESVDTKDVTVNIYSGGDEYGDVDIGAGDITTWDATFSELEDKTLYLDRWRPGLFGLPGKGGGSLLLWIPRSSAGGHITMHVRINAS